MKKNKMMRIASVLLVAVLLSTCVISGTFAKYVTSARGSDSARVAKFGVEVAVVVDGAFASEYAATADVATGTAIAKTVIASIKEEGDPDNVLAPGTAGWLLESATITGTPEVAVNVKYKANLELTGWEVNSAYYCPLIITITDKENNETAIHGLTYDSADKFEEAVEKALNKNENYQPNSNLGDSFSVAWRWDFDGTSNLGQTDVKDTALGDAAADPDGNAITIAFDLTVTVTQINGAETTSEEASSTVVTP